MTQIDLKQRVLALAEKTHPRQIKWRRHLHQYPETAFEEFKTTQFLKGELKRLGLKFPPLKMPTGILASIGQKRKGRAIAIRSDIDALPITEQNKIPFKSKIAGRMHACGHDVHMATVLGAAEILAQLSDQFKGEIRFLFQPAEEQPPGGARPMIANGALDQIDAILGLHIDPNLPVGLISLRDGPTMASVYDFDIYLIGKAGHAAHPNTAIDAISLSAEVIDGLQRLVSRETDPISPVAITIGKIEGGIARNVIADRVKITGTARALGPKTARIIPRLIKRTVSGICKARGASFEIDAIAGYPAVVNHPGINKLIGRSYRELYPGSRVATTDLTLGGEDFACYLEKVPGAMFRLGVRNQKIGADKPWHAVNFMVDESSMKIGSATLAMAALNYLNR